MRPLANSLKFLALGLALLVAACRSAEAGPPAPVKEAPGETKVEAPQIDSDTSQAEAATVAGEAQGVGNAPAMIEKAVEPAAGKALAAPVQEEVAPAAEPVSVTEAKPEQEEIATEAKTAPVEAEAMTEPATTTETGPTPAQLELLAGLPSQGAPPELFNEVWLNSEPLKLAGLRGQVVIVEFWTFG